MYSHFLVFQDYGLWLFWLEKISAIGPALVWHHFISLMNCFYKTEAAVLPTQTMLFEDFYYEFSTDISAQMHTKMFFINVIYIGNVNIKYIIHVYT